MVVQIQLAIYQRMTFFIAIITFILQPSLTNNRCIQYTKDTPHIVYKNYLIMQISPSLIQSVSGSGHTNYTIPVTIYRNTAKNAMANFNKVTPKISLYDSLMRQAANSQGRNDSTVMGQRIHTAGSHRRNAVQYFRRNSSCLRRFQPMSAENFQGNPQAASRRTSNSR